MTTTQEIIDRLENVSLEFVGDVRAVKAAADRLRELSEWRPVETAPSGVAVLVWGNGPIRFGYLDPLGNWRAMHHGPVRSTPTLWMPLPTRPQAGRNSKDEQ